jgi:hypothetical protein
VDEGVDACARALHVRVERKSASAAFAAPAAIAGRSAPAATRVPDWGRSRWRNEMLMQRQPWCPALKARRRKSRLKTRKIRWTFDFQADGDC